MQLKELFNMTEFDSSHHWHFYKDNIKLDNWNYELIKNLEIYKINLNAYFTTPYEGAGINVTVYLEEPINDIR